MNPALKRLYISIGVHDKTKEKLFLIQSRFRKFSTDIQHTTRGMHAAMGGLYAGAAIGGGMFKLASSAREMRMAIGDIRSLGTSDSAITALGKEATAFTSKYGGSAQQFVRDAYDIQSAIQGLAGADLANFASIGATLGKATKADAKTINDYMGTMYGIFEEDAKRMGNKNWVAQFAAYTAQSVNLFKTDGQKLAASFESLGGAARAHGIDMAEQYATIGLLNNQLSGSESGTAYKAFLRTVGKAQEGLGLDLVDKSTGNILPAYQILEKLQEKFGKTLESTESFQLQKVVGDESMKFYNALLKSSPKMIKNMQQIQQASMQTVESMALARTDSWDKLSGSLNGLAIIIGKQFLPVFDWLAKKITTANKAVMWFTDQFPNISRHLSYAGIAIASVIAAIGVLTAVFFTLKISVITLGFAFSWLKLSWIKAAFAFVLGAGKISIAAGVMKVITGAVWLFNAALLANPIGLIIAGVVAAMVAIGTATYFVIKNWEKVQAGIISAINTIIGYINKIPGVNIPLIADQINQSQTINGGRIQPKSITPSLPKKTVRKHKKYAL